MRAPGLIVTTGLVAGLLSGTPSALAWAAGRADPVAATRAIGRRVTGRPSLVAGGLAHLGLSCAFAWPAPVLARTRVAPVLGAAYGAGLYRVNFGLVAPRVWPEIRRYAGGVQLLDHLAYGLSLGIVARRLRRSQGRRR